MKDGIRISVVVITYNGEKYLCQQMDSILKNLSGQDEVVVSDDGSKDHTWELLERYAAADPRVRLFHGPGRGIIANVNAALLNCRGAYIYLSDQDDVWASDKVERIQQCFAQKKAHLIVHDNRIYNEDLQQELGSSFFAFRGCRPGFFRNIVKNSYIGCCMAFSAQLLEKALPIPEEIQMHDQWLGLMNDLYYKDSFFLEEKLLWYRRHEDNASDFSRNSLWVMIRNRMILLKCLGRHRKDRFFVKF